MSGASASPVETTTRMPPLCVRAAVQSVNADARTVELVFSTGAAVERFDYWTGKRYIEKLSLKPEAIRLDRLNAGAPLLDAHSSWSIADQIGVVVAGSVRLSAKEARATVRFSKRDAVEPIWRDVVDGIIQNVSVGYRVHKFEEETGKNEIPVRTATDWEPYEVSMVPMPADAGAKVREDEQRNDMNACAIVQRSQETPMEPKAPEHLIEENPLTTPRMSLDPATPPAPAAPAAPNLRDEGVAQERKRVQGIHDAVRAARMATSTADELVEEGISLLDAQTRIFKILGSREAPPSLGQGGGSGKTGVGDDPIVHVRKDVATALLHRAAPSLFPEDAASQQYRGMSLLDIARAYMNHAGLRAASMSPSEVAELALKRSPNAFLIRSGAGYHTTSDFPGLLADVANKILRKQYAEAPQTYAPLVTRRTVRDFKTINSLQIGDAPALKKVEEHGEVTYGTIGEGKESYKLATYARVFAITRQALINDDLNAFTRVPMAFGRKARILEGNLVWEQITTNPIMNDGNRLFSAAHANLSSNDDDISVPSLGEARMKLRTQTTPDGDRLDLSGRFLVVPASLETQADQFVTVVTPQVSGNVNPFQNRLTVIAEPRLDAASVTAWYVFASTDQIDMIEVANLEGETEPTVVPEEGFDIEGLKMKCRYDVAAKAIDWRGMFLNEGAT